MFKVNIYLESTIKSANRSNGMFGYLVEYETAKAPVTRMAFTNVTDVTANQLMLLGLINALQILKKQCEVYVYLDSPYIAHTINQKRIQEWSLKDWVKDSGKGVKNKSLWQMMAKQLDTHNIFVINTNENKYSKQLKSEIWKRRKKHV